MSNFLAIATVTATLRQMLENAVSRDVPGATATAVRPNAPGNQLPNPGVNLFLYHVTPNGAWRNADAWTRDADGGLVQHPRAAIDLHYLLSFYGNDADLEPQRALGSSLRALSERPLLPRGAIREVIAATPALTASNLDSEVESVKLTQTPLSLEELSKLWSVFFQTPYVLSVALQAGVVLIEGRGTPRASLPVRERNLYVVTLRQPVVERIEASAGAGQPVLAGAAIRIVGRDLRGEITRVRVGPALVTPPANLVSDTAIEMTLPAGLRAGVQGLQVEHPRLMGAPPALRGGIESNAAAFVLQPAASFAVTNVTPVVVDGVTLHSATVTATLDPAVGRTQRVKLLMYEFNAPDDRPARAYVFDAPPDNGITTPAQQETSTVTFSVEGVVPGAYLARVQVDGAESPLTVDGSGRFAAPQVTI